MTQDFENVSDFFARNSLGNRQSINPISASAYNYAGDIIKAYGNQYLFALNAFKMGKQLQDQADLYNKLQSSALDYTGALAELGFELPNKPSTQPNPERSSLSEVRKFLPFIPTTYEDYNKVKVANTRGCIIPTHLFFSDNWSAEDFLFFQYNFPEYTDKKSVRMEESVYLGYGASKEVWSHGTRRTLSFNLFFDATRVSMDAADAFSTPIGVDMGESIKRDPHAEIGVSAEEGTLGVVNKLQSYQYPVIQKSELESLGRPRFFNGVFEPAPRFESIPILLLILGKQVYQGRISSVDVNHRLMNKEYIPIRSECSVSFTVDEWDVHSDVSKSVLSTYNSMLKEMGKV